MVLAVKNGQRTGVPVEESGDGLVAKLCVRGRPGRHCHRAVDPGNMDEGLKFARYHPNYSLVKGASTVPKGCLDSARPVFLRSTALASARWCKRT